MASSDLAITTVDELVFGRAPKPVTTRSGLEIGGGLVYPEVNFTLPPVEITAATMPVVRAHYAEMIEGVCARAVELGVPGLVVEFELLPQMTMEPEWGAQVTAILRSTLDRYAASEGLISALRVTPNDIREHERPPRMREGYLWDRMVQSFAVNASAGAELLSIESTGGKELHDDGIIMGDLHTVAFALGVLGSRDMAFLWDMITDVSRQHGTAPAGDSACGFGNTAMVLAEKRYIPRVWAAVIRVMTVARSLVAHEHGASGPGKDCAYENPYLKVITGCPMSGEGAEAACAHLSPVGNIARYATDLWSNESIQNVKLLGGMAPVVSLEQLTYATRLLNTATAAGAAKAALLRDLYVESDAHLDPQAYVLHPEVVIALSREMMAETTPYGRTRRAAVAALASLRDAAASGLCRVPPQEQGWLDNLSHQADQLPEEEEALIHTVMRQIDRSAVLPAQYGLSA